MRSQIDGRSFTLFVRFTTFMPSLVEHVANTKLDRGTIDRPDLQLREESLAVLDADDEVQAAARVGLVVMRLDDQGRPSADDTRATAGS